MQAIEALGYNVIFGEDCYTYLEQLLLPEKYSRIFIIADTNTSQLCLPNFLANLATKVEIEIIEIEAGEINKTIETCTEVWYALTELEADRKSIIINVGGGMVTDLGGFVASTFKRGVDFINVPTSLLAMVDASVGGKTGVDLGTLKNQVGVINTPVAVLIDPQFLDTLPQMEMRSGLAEMFKHGLIADNKYWISLIDLTNLTTDDLLGLIHWSVEIKNTIVKQDPTEKGLRKLLNFGHTLGHAIESYFLENNNKEALLHGEAIAAGMVLESYISLKNGLINNVEYQEIKHVLLAMFGKIDFDEQDINEVMKLLVHDKKNEFGTIQFVLLDGIGKAIFNQPVENTLIFNAFEDYKT